MLDGTVVGTVTSGGRGHRLGMNLAYAFVLPEVSAPETAVQSDIIGQMTPATVIPIGPCDPGLERVRG